MTLVTLFNNGNYSASDRAALQAEGTRVLNFYVTAPGSAKGTDRGGAYGASTFGELSGGPAPTAQEANIASQLQNRGLIGRTSGGIASAIGDLAKFAAVSASGYYAAGAVFGAPSVVVGAGAGASVVAPAVAVAPVASTPFGVVGATGAAGGGLTAGGVAAATTGTVGAVAGVINAVKGVAKSLGIGLTTNQAPSSGIGPGYTQGYGASGVPVQTVTPNDQNSNSLNMIMVVVGILGVLATVYYKG